MADAYSPLYRCPYPPCNSNGAAFSCVGQLKAHVIKSHWRACPVCGYNKPGVLVHAWRKALYGDQSHMTYVVLATTTTSHTKHCRQWLRDHRQDVYEVIKVGLPLNKTMGKREVMAVANLV